MKKLLFLLVLGAFALGLNAQAKVSASASASSPNFGVGGMAGAYSINGETYTRFRLMPEVTLGKLGIGLDFDLLIDSNGQLRKQDWDEAEDYFKKIYYIRWAQRTDPFYARVGGFSGYTLGHGLVINNYSNMLRYPEYRKIGAQAGVNIKSLMNLNVEAFTGDITENDIMAGRVSFAPLASAQIPLLSNLRLGATIATDQDQYNGLQDTDDDNYWDVFDDYPEDDAWHNTADKNKDFWRNIYANINPSGTDDDFENWFYSDAADTLLARNPSKNSFAQKPITVWAADYELPLITGDRLSLGHYAEFASIMDHSYGFIFPGFWAKFFIFNANLEYRYYDKDFEPAYFGQLYDDSRASATKSNGTVMITTKEDLIPQLASMGWYGSLSSNLFNFVTLSAAYEDMYYESDDENPNAPETGRSLWATAALNTSAIPKLSIAQISYSQVREEKIFEEFRTPNTIIEAKAGYDLGNGTSLVYTYQETYTDADGNGKIKGEDETIKSYGIGMEFKF